MFQATSSNFLCNVGMQYAVIPRGQAAVPFCSYMVWRHKLYFILPTFFLLCWLYRLLCLYQHFCPSGLLAVLMSWWPAERRSLWDAEMERLLASRRPAPRRTDRRKLFLMLLWREDLRALSLAEHLLEGHMYCLECCATLGRTVCAQLLQFCVLSFTF